MHVVKCVCATTYIFYTYVHLPRDREWLSDQNLKRGIGRVKFGDVATRAAVSPPQNTSENIFFARARSSRDLRIVLIRLHLSGVYLIDISHVIIGL